MDINNHTTLLNSTSTTPFPLFGNILLEAPPINPYLVRLRSRGAAFAMTTCYPSLLPTLSRCRQVHHPVSASSSRFEKGARRQHANQTGKLRVTRKRKPKPDLSANKHAPTGAPNDSQGIQRQAISTKDQSCGLIAGQWQTFWGNYRKNQKQPSKVFFLAVKTANKQRNG